MPVDMQFANWVHSTPVATTITLNWGLVVVLVAIVSFVFGARLQLAWSRFVAGFRSTYVPGSFAAAFANAFLEAQARRHMKDAKSSDIAACAPPAPPVHLASVSKTPTRESGMQQHTHG